MKELRLSDYKKPDFSIKSIELDFDLYEEECFVSASIQFQKSTPCKDLVLFGDKQDLISLKINASEVTNYEIKDKDLYIYDVPNEFELYQKTRIEPQNNKSMEGLYKSNQIFCTQCEAESFRKIIYYLDRPDVLAVYTTHIRADKEKYPILLSNGNRIATEELENNRHKVTWSDPFPKPSYLFALVAGDLALQKDCFTTKSKRQVSLEIYTEHGNEDRVSHAMKSLKESMTWDEERWNLEYDLDNYMIVAVNDFNMGAMENKGLNIFNSKYVLAKPETATDSDYYGIQSVIAHEYFHNWSGNRITCRDWFQLSLKEGLTVFREQEFAADLNSRAVKRIDDVNLLRTRQFSEDESSNAHPVRPESAISIDNFYTLTIYEKGAELIRMMKLILGDDKFNSAMAHYYKKHDGQAVTTEDFVVCMEESSGIDLSQFRLWYTQAGTPQVQVKVEQTEDQLRLFFEQNIPDTIGQKDKKPQHIPILLGLLDENGNEILIPDSEFCETRDNSNLFHLKERKQILQFAFNRKKVVPSLLRDFSAPVRIQYNYSNEERAFLLANDKNSFTKWNACYQLSKELLLDYVENSRFNKDFDLYKTAITKSLLHLDDDPAFVSKLLEIPEKEYLNQFLDPIPVEKLHEAQCSFFKGLCDELEDLLYQSYLRCREKIPQVEAEKKAPFRQLKNRILNILCYQKSRQELAPQLYFSSTNMTEAFAAMSIITQQNMPEKEAVLNDFYKKWNKDSLVMNKWFRIQASVEDPDNLLNIQRLAKDPIFDEHNPNNNQSLHFAFATESSLGFHRKDGLSYKYFADQILRLDKKNPQFAAHFATAFRNWKKYDEKRRLKMKTELERLQAGNLSPVTYEIVDRALRY